MKISSLPSLTRLPAFLVFVCVCAPAQQPVAKRAQPGELEGEFQAAVVAYNAGHLPEAVSRLEGLEQRAPRNFGVHELLGLVYGAEAHDRQAVEQLTLAAHLNPQSAPAKANLGVSLVRTGEVAQAETAWREALALEPANYTANHSLAELYLRQDKVAEAQPLLAAAQAQRPSAADNGYDLALADLLLGRYGASRALIAQLQVGKDSGDLRSLLGRLDEKEGRFVDAANEFAAAARLDPSDDNLFAWGTELLLHRTYEPAVEVFREGTQRFPASPRLWIGLGMGLYSRGQYEDSMHALLKAADLNPADPRCYEFLSKSYLSSPGEAKAVIERFRRYATLEPDNALAQYYLAISLWKGGRLEDPNVDYSAVEALLHRSIALNGAFAEAHLQLGILYNDQHAYAQSLPEYLRAIELDPQLTDAHFRLARYYLRVGEKEKAHAELERFKQLQAQHQAEIDKERAEVQQFVVSTSSHPSPQQP